MQQTLEFRPSDPSTLKSLFARYRGKIPSHHQLILMRRQGYSREIELALAAHSLSTILFRLQRSIGRRDFNVFQLDKFTIKYLKSLIRLHNFLQEHQLPAVLYLRCHVEVFQGRAWVSALCCPRALKRFATWCHWHQETGWTPVQQEARLHTFNEMPDDTGRLLAEYDQGAKYLEWAKANHNLSMHDREVLLWMEQNALPGIYLLMDPVTRSWFEQGQLNPKAGARAQDALSRLNLSGVLGQVMAGLMSGERHVAA